MSARITGMIFARYPGGGGELLLALALGDHAHDDGTHIFPSVAALSAKTRQSERTVQYQLRNMEAGGWLQKVRDEQRGRPGMSDARRRGREYRINPEWIAGQLLGSGGRAPDASPEKGANSAPFSDPDRDVKGAEAIAPSADGNGCNPGDNGTQTLPATPLADSGPEKGANIAPFSESDQQEKGATAIAPFPDGKGCNPEQKRVQPDAEKGATAIAPEPSVNHQYSNHQEESAGARPPPPAASDPTSSPPINPAHGTHSPDTQAEFPADWQPCDLTRALLASRQMPMPAKFVINGFVAHWADRWIAPRRIPNEFVKWVCREAGMRGGRVPTDEDGGVSKAEAEAAWHEVREANRRGRRPDAGWAHALTEQALIAIGGLSSLRDMLSHQASQREREFVRAYLAAGAQANPPSNQSRRSA